MSKCPTGIQGLDEITGGGRPTPVCGGAGCGKTLLAAEFLVRGAMQFGEPGVLLAFEETKKASPTAQFWRLCLDVASASGKSLAAFLNLKEICESRLNGRYRIEVVDWLKHPEQTEGDRIPAIPAVARKLPQPLRILICGLSQTQRLLAVLDPRPA